MLFWEVLRVFLRYTLVLHFFPDFSSLKSEFTRLFRGFPPEKWGVTKVRTILYIKKLNYKRHINNKYPCLHVTFSHTSNCARKTLQFTAWQVFHITIFNNVEFYFKIKRKTYIGINNYFEFQRVKSSFFLPKSFTYWSILSTSHLFLSNSSTVP